MTKKASTTKRTKKGAPAAQPVAAPEAAAANEVVGAVASSPEPASVPPDVGSAGVEGLGLNGHAHANGTTVPHANGATHDLASGGQVAPIIVLPTEPITPVTEIAPVPGPLVPMPPPPVAYPYPPPPAAYPPPPAEDPATFCVCGRPLPQSAGIYFSSPGASVPGQLGPFRFDLHILISCRCGQGLCVPLLPAGNVLVQAHGHVLPGSN